MDAISRIARHTRITLRNRQPEAGPPFLILFINSICNQKCDHCFYWKSLNGKDDLSRDEIFALSRSLGRIETLNLSGGEPFLRAEFGEICRQFIQHNKVRQIYVPTNGYFTDRTVKQITETLKEPELDLFVAEISLDGLGEFHNKFRGSPGAFDKAMLTYDALAKMQESDPRLRIHSISTATDVNMDEIRRLTSFLYDRCPKMDHHNLAMIRGDRKNPSLHGPGLEQYRRLYDYVRRLWSDREKNRYGSIVEPMLQWAKTRTATAQTQVVPCRAGILNAVVYANGDVSVCENHAPLGNLRQKSFPEIWKSPEAVSLRESIAAKNCYCTNEVFLYPSITFQPTQLLRAMVGARLWQNTTPLGPEEKITATIEDGTLSPDHARLVSIQVPAGRQ
ncbi:MAG TPA: radical SAM protein [Bryobacteraceae bacterium]|jgi:MoaA/NifB/PqqE/SkfB family radical SAM enzyme|nr:radical SAM protein [Bryobacteraceae bacterium]